MCYAPSLVAWFHLQRLALEPICEVNSATVRLWSDWHVWIFVSTHDTSSCRVASNTTDTFSLRYLRLVRNWQITENDLRKLWLVLCLSTGFNVLLDVSIVRTPAVTIWLYFLSRGVKELGYPDLGCLPLMLNAFFALHPYRYITFDIPYDLSFAVRCLVQKIRHFTQLAYLCVINTQKRSIGVLLLWLTVDLIFDLFPCSLDRVLALPILSSFFKGTRVAALIVWCRILTSVRIRGVIVSPLLWSLSFGKSVKDCRYSVIVFLFTIL